MSHIDIVWITSFVAGVVVGAFVAELVADVRKRRRHARAQEGLRKIQWIAPKGVTRITVETRGIPAPKVEPFGTPPSCGSSGVR